MSFPRVSAFFKSVIAGGLLLALAGCSSNMTRVETWEGEPANAADAATLRTPGEIQVASVNGRSVSNFLMEDLSLDFALLPGQNEVVFTYKTIWGKSGVVENGESKVNVVESEPQVVRIAAEPGSVYRFEFDEPSTYAEAREMVGSFSATVVNEGGQEVAQSTVWEPRKQMADRTPIPAADDGQAVVKGGTALEQLKSVWATATEEEKRAFLRWAFE